MRKKLKHIMLCAGICALCWCWGIIGDRQTLNQELIRLHVVAESDSDRDQQIKLRVRDAVMESLSKAMADMTDVEQAKLYIQAQLPKIEKIANDTLQYLGCESTARVSFQEEVFDTRIYDTFTLPAGVYEALRITIGSGEGKNWWCVVFPTLCMSAVSEEFADVAVGAGFSDSLTAALEGKEGYEVRFYLLDMLGRLEGYFRKG